MYIKKYLLVSLIGFFGSVHIAFSQSQNDEWSNLKNKLSTVKATWTKPPADIVNTKLSTGMLMGNGDIGVVAGDSINQQKFYFGKSDFWGASVKNPKEEKTIWQESILSLGGLTINSPTSGSKQTSVFKMEQDIQNAEIRTSMQLGKAAVKMTSWTADAKGTSDNNFFITELSSDKDVLINADLWVPSTYKIGGKELNCADIYPYTSGVNNGKLWITRENYNYNLSDHSGNYKVRAAMALSLFGASFKGTTTDAGKASGIFMLKAGTNVYIAVAFVSSKTAGTRKIVDIAALKNIALSKVATLNQPAIINLQNAHRSWWKRYWLKSWVNLDDPVLEKFYYSSLYILGCSSRAGNFPPSLFGNWITTDLASWGGRYFLNYNEEAAYYGAASSNRPELILPYSDLILNEMIWQKNKTHAAGYEGVCHQRSLTPYHLVSDIPLEIPVAGMKDYKKLPADQKSNGVFAVMPLVWYYEYTQDKNYLREKLYPYLKELEAFYRSYINKDSKPYMIEHSSAHEGSDDVNPNLDLGYICRICKTLIDASKILNTDEKMRPVWQDVLDNLSDYAMIIRDGKRVYTEALLKNGGTKNLFHVGCQPINLEGGVFPGENIYLGSDTSQLQIARESLNQLGGWCVNQAGSEHNGFPKEWPIAARIGWPADDLYSKFREAILFHWREANYTTFQGGGGIETAGAIEGINSMLMQSEGGIIKLFPVWPKTKNTSFQRLRAKGAFLVCSEFKNGQVEYLKIHSEKGGLCKISNPWPGETIQLKRNGKDAEKLSVKELNTVENTITFSTKENELVEIHNIK